MEFVFPLSPHSFSVAWGSSGAWVDPTEAWFADDPFVLAHPEMFSVTPPKVHPMAGRSVERGPLPVQETTSAPVRRGRNG